MVSMLSDLFFDIGRLGLPSETQPAVWIVSAIIGAHLLERAGVISVPNLQARGDLSGVVTVLFGHSGFPHLLSNAIGLAILLSTYLVFVDDPWPGLIVMALVPGLLTWAFASRMHESRGASDLVYALFGWWLVYFASPLPLPAILLIVAFMAGIGFFATMNPFGTHHRIHLMGHFYGFVTGVVWTIWGADVVEPYLSKWR